MRDFWGAGGQGTENLVMKKGRQKKQNRNVVSAAV